MKLYQYPKVRKTAGTSIEFLGEVLFVIILFPGQAIVYSLIYRQQKILSDMHGLINVITSRNLLEKKMPEKNIPGFLVMKE